MIRRRKLRGRFARYPRRWPVVVMWAAGAAVAAAVPLGIAYLRGGDAPTTMGETPDAVLETLTHAVPAVALTFLALIALAWCIRRVSLEGLAWRPGRIEVAVFASGPGVSADAAQLTMAFRQRLAMLSLSAPTPVPGAAIDGDFLDVLGREKLDAGNVAGSIVSLLRAAKPAHAWQVSGLLVKRDRAPSYGVTLQVAQLPHRGNPPQTVWADRFEDAVRSAADHATAAILPRTRLCREPWAAWKHFVLPGELLSALEEGVRLESERRYDEALDAYYRASGFDPMNMALRLNIGQLQEKLGLYLDALMTYEGMIEVSRKAPVWWPFRYRRAARSQRRRALVAARYRRIVLLGGAELAEQWRLTGPQDRRRWSARDERRFELRARLRRSLEALLADVHKRHRAAGANESADPGCALPLGSLRRRGGTLPAELLAEQSLRYRPSDAEQRCEDRDRFEFRELLALLALKELQSLPLRQLRFLDRRLMLTPQAVRLTQMCIEVRLAWIQAQLPSATPTDEAVCWPPRPERLQSRIERIEGRHRFGRWHEHYNAACAYALPLMAELSTPAADVRPEPGATASESATAEAALNLRTTLADLAVERLARATSCADSGYIAGRRDWLISEDPDLDGLRAHQPFREFEAMYFPSDAPTPPRPRHVRQLESARYVNDLLAQTASRWELEWHRRGGNLDAGTDVHVTLDWWMTELRAWELVRQVAFDHRHWPARLKLIREMRVLASRYGFAPLDVSFHRYEEQPLCDPSGTLRCEDAGHAADLFTRRLMALHSSLPDRRTRKRTRVLLRTLEQWQSTLRQLDVDGLVPDPLVLAALCDHHAALWQLLREWLAAEPTVRQQAWQTAFVAQISRHDATIAARAEAFGSNGRPRRRGGESGRRGQPQGARPPVARRGS